MLQRIIFSIWLTGCCLFCPALISESWAQLEQAKRIELTPDANQDESFDVIPLEDSGMLLTVRRIGYYAASAMQFRFLRYNTDLKELWAVEYKPDIRFSAVMSYHNEQYLYWLFHENDSDKYMIFRLNLDDGITETFEGKLLYGFDVQQFKVLGNQAYIGGYHRNRPVVMAFSFFDLTAKVLPGLYANHMEISSIELDEERREINVLVQSIRRRCQFSIRSYSYDSKPLRTVDFEGANHSLISGKMLRINDDESLLVGNYSTDCTPYSQGVYVTRINRADNGPANPSAIQYIEFSELKNFFNYLKPKRQQKLLAKVLRRKEEGKDVKFRYRLLVHDLMRTDEGLLLVAEVYYPQYRGTALPYSSGAARTADRYFEGYRYTHAFMCGFDKEGNFLWDNCLPIQDLESSELTEKVQVSRQGDKLVLAYPKKDEINTEVIQGGKTLKELENYSLKASLNGGKVVNSERENVVAWYGQYFLASGFQKISADKNGFGPSQREVFYINKLTYTLKDLSDSTTNTSTVKGKSPGRYE